MGFFPRQRILAWRRLAKAVRLMKWEGTLPLGVRNQQWACWRTASPQVAASLDGTDFRHATFGKTRSLCGHHSGKLLPADAGDSERIELVYAVAAADWALPLNPSNCLSQFHAARRPMSRTPVRP